MIEIGSILDDGVCWNFEPERPIIYQKPLNGKYNCILKPNIIIIWVIVAIDTGFIYVVINPKPILIYF